MPRPVRRRRSCSPLARRISVLSSGCADAQRRARSGDLASSRAGPGGRSAALRTRRDRRRRAARRARTTSCWPRSRGWRTPTRLRAAADAARQSLSGDDDTIGAADALSLVAVARKSLEAERDHDPSRRRARRSAGHSVVRARRLCRRYRQLRHVARKPTRSDWPLFKSAEPRWRRLTRKYGETLDEVLGLARAGPRRACSNSTTTTRRVDALRAELAELTATRDGQMSDA